MYSSIATTLLGLTASYALAQSSSSTPSDSASGPVVSLFLVGADNQQLVASVVDASPSATTYLLNCPDGTDGNDCGIYDAMVTAAPSAVDFLMQDGDAFTGSIHCDVTSFTIPGTCTEVDSGSEANDPGTSIYSPGPDSYTVLPVTVTAGAEKLASASAGGSASPTSSGSGMSPATGSSSGSAQPASSASPTGAAATGTSSTGSAASSDSTAQATNGAGRHDIQLWGAAAGVGAAILML